MTYCDIYQMMRDYTKFDRFFDLIETSRCVENTIIKHVTSEGR